MIGLWFNSMRKKGEIHILFPFMVDAFRLFFIDLLLVSCVFKIILLSFWVEFSPFV